MSSICSKIANSSFFQRFIIATILLAGIVVGAQTYKDFAIENAKVLQTLDHLVLIIFTVEALIKILAEGNRPLNYFKNPWNIFDFAIVTACLLEPFIHIGGAFLPVLRLPYPQGFTPCFCYSKASATCFLPFKKPALDVLCQHPSFFAFLHLWRNGSFSFWRKRPHTL